MSPELRNAIEELEKVPKFYRDMIDERFEDLEEADKDFDTRLRKMTAKYNEVLGLMHGLGDRIEAATNALVALAEANRRRP